MDTNEVWLYLKSRYKEDLVKVSYDTWIEPAKVYEINDSIVTIEVPAGIHKDYWENHLITSTVEYLYESYNKEITPKVVTSDEIEEQSQQDQIDTVASTLQQESDKQKYTSNGAVLNDKYTFQSFVIGKGNQMAHAAALVVAEEPGTTYNPLFIYGGVGLGKTHLMHAIGHRMLELRPTANIKYVTSEKFANDFINSIKYRTQEAFREEYRTVDLLLVDDIQFFADKEGTQEEFFHTFNALYEDRKQIVLTSDRLPNEIPKLQERLVSRFAWGLSVDITPPDLETRIAILRNKADAEHLEIPESTLSYIAGQIDSNIRELEGALLRVQAYAAIENLEITTSLAADALKSMVPDKNSQRTSVSTIIEDVAKYYNLTGDEIKGKKRVASIVRPRQIAMYLAREITGDSFPKIGKEFGGKDHTTIMYAHDKIGNLVETDFDLKNDLNELRSKYS